MKRALVIISTVVTLFAAGVLYANHVYTDSREMVSLEEAYNAQYPGDLKMDVVLEPMAGFPL